jgi:hypothetical protein
MLQFNSHNLSQMDGRTKEGWKERPHLVMGSLLGNGRFGGVYSAVDETDESEFAVKVISFFKLLESDMDFKKLTKMRNDSGDDSQLLLICEQAVHQFLLEVQQMRRVSSENVVQLIDHWIEGPLKSVLLTKPTDIKSIVSSLPSNLESSEDTFLYIQMELCQQTLEEWIEDRIKYGIRKEIHWELKHGALLQITSGLNDLHNEGIVHCDLEPKSILVRMEEEETTFKIGGLGDSKWFDDESRGLEFQRMAKSDIESLAIEVFNFVLMKVEAVKAPWEFYREQQFVDSIDSGDTTYFGGCSCKFLISFLSNEDTHLYEESLEDNVHDFKTCVRCMYNYWSSNFLSQYENINFRSDILNLRDKVNNIERYIYQIKVKNEADARYSTHIVNGCLKEAGLKVVALEGRKFLDLVHQGQGSIAIDHLKLNKINLLILICYSMNFTETLSLTQISDKLDGISVNTLIIACEDMKGKHGVFIDKPTVSWEDLTDQSKARLLRHKMNLQGRTLVLGEYFQELDTESLRLVLSDSQRKLNIPIGPNSDQSKLPQPYIHRKFQKVNSKKAIPETDMILMNNKLVLISDGPGAGKSTVLIQLFQTLSGFDGLWGHVIYLNRFLDSLLEWKASSVPLATLLFEMLKANLQNGELQTLFETAMEGNTSLKLVLFLDALDEVAPDSYDNVTNILKQLMDKPGISKIVLTTRPHLFMELQKSFEQTAIFLKLVPISHREQIEYIMTAWEDANDIRAKSCVKEFNELCSFSETPLESPLLLSMLAEHTKTEKHLPMSLHEFYSAVVDRKLEVSIEEKLGVKSEGKGLGPRNVKNKLKNVIKTCLQWLAMTVIRFGRKENLIEQANPPNWDEEQLRRTLLVEGCGRNIFFVHRTFAEYFFGLYLANSIEDITPGQMAELSFSWAMLGIRSLFDLAILSKYFTQQRSQIFWNSIICSPAIFDDRVFAFPSKANRGWQAVILRSLLQHCDRETIIQILELDDANSMLRFNMNEWQWSFQQLQEKVGHQFIAEIFFRKNYSKRANSRDTLWHKALNNKEKTGGLLYARQLWDWLRSNSCTIEKEDKVKLLLRGRNVCGFPSLLKAVESEDSIRFITEVLTGLSLSPERVREELMALDEDDSNLLHCTNKTLTLSVVQELLDKFLSKGDVDTLLFQGLSEVPIKLVPL